MTEYDRGAALMRRRCDEKPNLYGKQFWVETAIKGLFSMQS